MRVIKRLNNNVAICEDGNGQELIALGKGIGFPKTPYELTDLSKVDMTFYRVSSQAITMLSTLPENVIMASSEIIQLAQKRLKNQFSSNVVFSLADHINFALERTKKNEIFDFSLSYDVQHLYPQEYQVGLDALKIIKNDLKVQLPGVEATAIAMHFINARENTVKNLSQIANESIFKLIIKMIESAFGIKPNSKSFAFNRFKIHLQYFFKRIEDKHQIEGEISPTLIKDMILTSPQIYRCSQDIIDTLDQKFHTEITDDEMFYLMIYIERMIKKENKNE